MIQDGYPPSTQFIFNSSSAIIAKVSTTTSTVKVDSTKDEDYYKCYSQNFPMDQSRTEISENTVLLNVTGKLSITLFMGWL